MADISQRAAISRRRFWCELSFKGRSALHGEDFNVDMHRGKAIIEALAIFGGLPEFTTPLHVGRPNIGDRHRLLERINTALDRRWLTNDGPYLREFESRLAEFVGVEHCVVVSSGMMALQLAIRATGLTGEVIVPSFTFIGTPHALLWEGLTPVFCDVDPTTHNLDPARITELITPRTSGILGVHLWGRACDIAALEQIADGHGLQLLFDAAHAIGCSYKHTMLGRFGAAEAFSFHATKCLNSFEGGAVATRNAEIAERVRLMRSFGFADIDHVESLGVNGKLNEVSAAMGLCSLEAMSEFVRANRENYTRYRRELSSVPGIRMIEYDESESCNFHSIVVEVESGKMGLSRDELQQILWHENVLARRYFFPPCHRMKPYCNLSAYAEVSLPVTEGLSARVLSLPNGTAVGVNEVEGICGLIRFAQNGAAAIRAKQGQMSAAGRAG